MGFNTNITICNDGFGALRNSPGEFVEKIISNAVRGADDLGVANHGGILTVNPSEHADFIQIIASGGNYSTRLHSVYMGVANHRDEDVQIRLLKSWADKLGYRVSKKPGKKNDS